VTDLPIMALRVRPRLNRSVAAEGVTAVFSTAAHTDTRGLSPSKLTVYCSSPVSSDRSIDVVVELRADREADVFLSTSEPETPSTTPGISL